METYGAQEGNGGALEEGFEAGRERVEQVRSRLAGMGRRLEEIVRERPGTALVVALSAGFLVGRLIRR